MNDGRFSAIDAFLAVARTGGFGTAARDLGLTQSTVSRRVASLESRMGVQLFARTTRSVKLTEAGRQYFEQARDALAILNAAESAIGTRRDDLVGNLRVAAPTALGRVHLLPVLAAVMAGSSQLRFRLDLSDRYEDLNLNDIDLAIRFTSDAPSGWTAMPIGDVSRHLCASPAYVAGHGAPHSVADLRSHRLVAAATYAPRTQWTFTQNGRPESIEVEPVLIVSDFFAARDAVVAGIGITVLPGYLADDAMADGRLVRVMEDVHLPAATVFAVQPQHLRNDARLSAVVGRIRQRLSG